MLQNNSTKYFYVRDCLENILGIIDSTGNLIVKYEYSGFGKCTVSGTSATTIGAQNPFRFKGYYYDTESDMYYCQSRYYVPEWGRWLNTDNPEYLEFDKMDNMNLFAYCKNDPINMIDGTGEIAISTIIAIIAIIAGAAIGGGVKGKKAADEGKKGWDLAKEIIGGIALGAAATGMVVAAIGAGATVVIGTRVVGSLAAFIAAKQVFAVGALAVNISAFGLAPLVGIEIPSIDYSSQTTMPNKSAEYQHPGFKR